MNKEKKWNICAIIGTVLILGLTYILFKIKCFGSCDTEIIKPLFWGLLSVIPTLLLLYAFSERILISWFKHIAWWIVLVGAWAVTNNENENDLSPFADDITIIVVLATLLFIITLVYALVMNRRIKKNLQ